jgi:flavin-dependent dehydrogenase
LKKDLELPDLSAQWKRRRRLLPRTDVFVIGGGPAGLAAALAVRQRGFEVAVADSLAPPIDKPCGEGLMPDGVSALKRLGVNIPATEGHLFRGIRFVSSGLSVAAKFPYGTAVGVRRTNLHRIMVEHAEAAGVRFLWRAVVTGLHGDNVVVNNGAVRARWTIGADGAGSRVRRWAGLDTHRRKEQRYAFRRHYRVAPWTEFMELHWGPNFQLYVTPVGPEEVCVALISTDSTLRLQQALPAFPAVAERLAGAKHGSVERGAVSVTRKLARVCSANVALVGDASGGIDAITGEGLCLAFQQADLLAECLASADLAAYQSGHRALARRPAMMARLMLLLQNRRLRARVMQAFVSKPKLFEHMLATHLGAASPLQAATNGVALGWELLIP